MAKKQNRAASRKVKDRWKSKEWYNILAPQMFNLARIGETLSSEPDTVVGRVATVTLQDLTGDFSKAHLKLKFKVRDIRGYDAYTEFIAHDMANDYVRRLSRRHRSKVDTVVDVKTADNYILRIKTMAVVDRRMQAGQRTGIRNITVEVLREYTKNKSLAEVVKGMVTGELSKILANKCRPIVPVRRMEIRKSEVLKPGDVKSVDEIIEEEKKRQEEEEAKKAEEAARKAAEAEAREKEEAEKAEESAESKEEEKAEIPAAEPENKETDEEDKE